jgi:hypothetical protein
VAALSKTVAVDFYALCRWTHKAWQVSRSLSLTNVRSGIARLRGTYLALGMLSSLADEHFLLQVSKLHDRGRVAGKATLGLAYVMQCDWPDAVRGQLEPLYSKLEGLAGEASELRRARNEAVSHNDLEAIAAGTTYVLFRDGQDRDYFEALKMFAAIVQEAVVGSPSVDFSDAMTTEVERMLVKLSQ